MKRLLVVAAFAAACLGSASMAPAAAQQQHYSIDREAVFTPSAVDQPSTDPARAFETAETTAYTPDGNLELPWGDLAGQALTFVLGLVGLIAAALLRKMPAAAVAALDMLAGLMGQGRANELLEKAITFGINTTAGAVKGKTLKVEIGNEVLERAFEYALRHAPNLVEQLGGMIGLREKIIARLDLEEDAAIPAPRPPAESLISRAPMVGAAPA